MPIQVALQAPPVKALPELWILFGSVSQANCREGLPGIPDVPELLG